MSPPRAVDSEGIQGLAVREVATARDAVLSGDSWPAPAQGVPEREQDQEDRSLAGEQGPPPRDRLGDPSRARRSRRHLFDPQKGWVRRAERAASLFLARHVYPSIPFISRPYDWVLRRSLTLSECDVELPGLPEGFEGLRVLLVTDPHAGPFVSPMALRLALERLQAVEPDLILVGGDLTSSKLSEFTTHASAFATLDAPMGVYAVLGNHDHYTEKAAELRQQMEDVGMRVLHNESVELERGGDRLSLAGIDDLMRGKPDLQAALANAKPPVVLLSHNPDVLFEAVANDVSLVLSGHTHGGQIRMPGLGVLVRQSRYRLDEGRYRRGDTELVVSRGLGAVGLPWRAHCSPEGVLLRFRRRGGAA